MRGRRRCARGNIRFARNAIGFPCRPVLPALGAATAIAAALYTRVFFANNGSATSCDLIVSAFDPSRGIPLLWLICPILTMAALGRIWSEKENPIIVARAGNRKTFSLSMLLDALACSLIVSTTLMASFIILGVTTGSGFCDFNNGASRFAIATQGQTIVEKPIAGIIGIMFAYAALSQMMLNGLFCAIRAVCGPKSSFAAVVLLCVPAVHAHDSFIYDAVRNVMGGSIVVPNPLSVAFEWASVSYASWLPGASHHLLGLAVFALCAIIFACAANLHREYAR